MEKHIIKINLGTAKNINLKEEIIHLNIFTLQKIIEIINEDSNYIFPIHFINLWDIFKTELQKYKISEHNNVSYIITSAEVKIVQKIVKPFKDMIQSTMDRYNSIYSYTEQITDPIEICEYLFKYKEKEQHNLLPYTYQNFLLEKAHQMEFERISVMEQWRIEDEARKEQELEELKQQEEMRRQEELKQQQEMRRQEELKQQQEMRRQEELKQQEEMRRQEELRQQEEYNDLCLKYYKNNIKNRSNKYCLFYIHPYKECNMKGTGKKCGFIHKYPSLKILKESRKCMKRCNSK